MNKCGDCKKYWWCAISSWILMWLSGGDGPIDASDCPVCPRFKNAKR